MSGSDEDIRLLSVAESISEGTPVDWSELDTHADPNYHAIVSELKVLEEMARIHEDTPKAWGPFTIVGEIARGAFGTVFIASDPALGLTLALKVIRPRHADVPLDPAQALTEARLLAKITHPNVVRVFRADRIGNEVGVAMELVKGRTLEDLVQNQSIFSAREATLIGIDLCHALAAVHRSGALHGDIKAHNVMRGEGGRTVLMDFGAGKDLNVVPRHAGPDFVGTPLYMAPEVFAGQPRSKTTDIYSLGVLLYYLVSRSYPVEGSTRTEVERGHQPPGRHIPLRDVRPDLPDDFVRVVDRAVAERPDDRYQSAGELETALSAMLMPVVPFWKRTGVTAAMLLVFALAALIYRWSGQPTSTARTTNAAVATTAAVPAPVASYRIKAVLNRDRDGVEVPLVQGTRLALSERVSMTVDVSTPAYIYVVNEDERGNSYLLFPLPGREPVNPLAAGRHRLPGMLADEKLYWQVTTAGGREHFVVIASPSRSAMFERMFATLPSPVLNQLVSYPKLSTDALGVLRSVGGLAVAPAHSREQLRTTPEFAIPLTGTEETVQGVWIRQAMFENPE
ncbi:MAG TPA: serine/threonine-protein kinase [Vicinamibacterales bacterium]|nr:serine/threonine-protein kinase [Vicinamibacterales bacterium]